MQHETILFPTDFSDSASDALETATALARTLGARLHLLNAIVLETPFVVPTDGAVPVPTADVLDERDRHSQLGLDKAASLIADPTVQVTTESRRGEATVDAILESARECAADLIVMSSHGRRGFRRFLLGSVTEELVRRAPCPVLVIRRDPDLRHPASSSRILAAIDFSPISEQVMSTAKSLASTLGQELDLIHVVHLPGTSTVPVEATPFGPVAPAPPESVSYEERLTKGRELLEHTDSQTGPPGIEARLLVRGGNPESEILRHAEENDIGLIVVGTQGHSGISRLLLGSVCERVLRSAPCAVYVVPRGDAVDA